MRDKRSKKKDESFSIGNDQSIGLLRKRRRKVNHVRRMRIREESITLNISSRAISDCYCGSNLPDRNIERRKNEERIVLSLH